MEMVNINIDGKKLTVNKGTSILDAATENSIYIPNLCHHPDLIPSGNCRMCMVEIEGRRGQIIACKTPVEDGMIIRTESQEISLIRQITLELIHVNHTQDCTSCNSNSACELQKVTAYVGIDEERFARLRRTRQHYDIDDSNPFFMRCISSSPIDPCVSVESFK